MCDVSPSLVPDNPTASVLFVLCGFYLFPSSRASAALLGKENRLSLHIGRLQCNQDDTASLDEKSVLRILGFPLPERVDLKSARRTIEL